MLERIHALKLGFPVSGPWPSAKLGLLERWYAAQPVPRVAGCVLELAGPLDRGALTGALDSGFRRDHEPV